MASVGTDLSGATSTGLWHPHLLSVEGIQHFLSQRKISFNSNNKDELLAIFNKHILALPQRTFRRNRQGQLATKKQILDRKKKRPPDIQQSPLLLKRAKEESDELELQYSTRLKPPPDGVPEHKLIELGYNMKLSSRAARFHTSDNIIIKDKSGIAPLDGRITIKTSVIKNSRDDLDSVEIKKFNFAKKNDSRNEGNRTAFSGKEECNRTAFSSKEETGTDMADSDSTITTKDKIHKHLEKNCVINSVTPQHENKKQGEKIGRQQVEADTQQPVLTETVEPVKKKIKLKRNWP